MKKADFRLPYPAGLYVFEATNPAFTKRNKPMQFSEVSIVTPTAQYVQMLEAENAPVKNRYALNAVI